MAPAVQATLEQVLGVQWAAGGEQGSGEAAADHARLQSHGLAGPSHQQQDGVASQLLPSTAGGTARSERRDWTRSSALPAP